MFIIFLAIFFDQIISYHFLSFFIALQRKMKAVFWKTTIFRYKNRTIIFIFYHFSGKWYYIFPLWSNLGCFKESFCSGYFWDFGVKIGLKLRKNMHFKGKKVLYFAFFGAFFQKNQYRASIIANKKALFLAISGLS